MPRNDQKLGGLKTLIKGDFFDLAGLSGLTDKEREEIMLKMLESVKNRVLLRIDGLIKKEGKPRFNQLLDEGDEKKISHFMKEQGIDPDQLVAEEALILKKEVLEKIKK